MFENRMRPGSELLMLDSAREISRYRVWVARAVGLLLFLFAYGAQASASPTRWVNVEGAPVVTLILIVVIFGGYALTLQLLSRPSSGDE